MFQQIHILFTVLHFTTVPQNNIGNMVNIPLALPLPALPSGWSSEKDFKAVGHLSAAVQRNVEPVGPHFLAHARRKRHKRTFSEDERIEAQRNVKKLEDEDAGEISEPEDPVMLQRDAKDWKVGRFNKFRGKRSPRIDNENRTKIITQFLVFPSTDSELQRNRSRRPTARRC